VKLRTVILWLAGVALFGWIVAQSDLGAVADYVGRIGAPGAVAVALLFFPFIYADVWAWQLSFRSLPQTLAWSGSLTRVFLAGRAWGAVLPVGQLGGEPVKALFLKRRYGVSYREGTATLLLLQTVTTLAQLPLVMVGLGLILANGLLEPVFRIAALVGWLLMAGFMVFVLVLLRKEAMSRLAHWLSGRGRFWQWLQRHLEAIRHIEEHLIEFLHRRPKQFAGSVLLAFVAWMHGVVEIYLIAWLLDVPLSFWACWQIEAITILVRSFFFFMPSHIGTQDGAIVGVTAALTGLPELGLAIALMRRARELVWIGVGFALGWGATTAKQA